ncbi:MAG: hypothetical protein SF123_19255 [Chloroflexota bacterium]|nr:hypothetical protein [Chloroflexota bacterium]
MSMQGAKVKLTDGEMTTVRAAMHAILIDYARQRKTITYSELAVQLPIYLHPHSFVFSRLLRDVCGAAFAAGEGQLCALVVSKQTGLPSSGYFVGTAAPGRDMSDLEAAWREDLNAVFERWMETRDA